MPTPLRERKRERTREGTRQALLATAERLFREQGYEATTLEQICAEVDVHVRTLHRYFEGKEHIVLARQYEGLARFRAEILSPGRDIGVVAFWRRFVQEHAARSARRPSLVEHLQLVLSMPAVAPLWLAIVRDYEDLLATALADEAGEGPEAGFRARLLAVLLVGGVSTIVRDWVAGGCRGDLEARCLEAVDYAVERFPLTPVATGKGRTR